MATVYIVTEGMYSSYNIVTVFSDRANAEAFIELYNANGRLYDLRVEEYELDTGVRAVQSNMRFYYVWMDREGEGHAWLDWKGDEPRQFTRQRRRSGDVVVMCGKVLARDEQHALKIMNERRAQAIALNQWPELHEIDFED